MSYYKYIKYKYKYLNYTNNLYGGTDSGTNSGTDNDKISKHISDI
jgi:hypothetical protein